jgi:glycerol kinase
MTASSKKGAARPYVLVLDAGTTTMRAIAFDESHNIIGKSSTKLAKRFPKRGWVEQDPRQMAALARQVIAACVRDNRLDARACRGLGITNQRETTIAWDSQNGRPIYPAIVWEDVRTSAWCKALSKEHGDRVRQLTGLAIDPYFSATKITWLLAHVPSARRLLEQGRLKVGTVDTWLIWNLAADHPHVTDETNAHRTLLVDAAKRRWSRELLGIFKVPETMLPTILPSRAAFGTLDTAVLGVAVPILAVCGDQQSSLYAAWRHGNDAHATKITYGTGTFIDQVTGRSFRPCAPFYTSLVPAPGRGTAYSCEGKIAKGARQVDPLLGDEPRLRRFLKGLAAEAARHIAELPYRPRLLVTDGGVSRDGIVSAYQQTASGLPVRPLPIFDGTALGTARLTWESVNKK